MIPASIAMPALMIIDMQRGVTSAAAGPRNNPDAELNIGALLAAWRDKGAAVVHVRHISRTPGSVFWPGQSGVEFLESLAPWSDEQDRLLRDATNCGGSARHGARQSRWRIRNDRDHRDLAARPVDRSGA